jgi:hypothetical protein
VILKSGHVGSKLPGNGTLRKGTTCGFQGSSMKPKLVLELPSSFSKKHDSSGGSTISSKPNPSVSCESNLKGSLDIQTVKGSAFISGGLQSVPPHLSNSGPSGVVIDVDHSYMNGRPVNRRAREISNSYVENLFESEFDRDEKSDMQVNSTLNFVLCNYESMLISLKTIIMSLSVV